MQTNVPAADFPFLGEASKELTSNPASRLMLAILEDAIVTFQRGLNSPLPGQRRRFQEVDDWVASDDTDWPFSFENVCTALSLDADYIRAGLRRMKRDAFAKELRYQRGKLRRERICARRGWRGQVTK